MTDATVTESPDFDVPDHVPAELVRVFDHFNEPGLKANPVTFYDEIRRGDHPTFWSPVFGGFWVLTRFDDIKTVLQDAEGFKNEHMSFPGKSVWPRKLIPVELDPPLHMPYKTVEAKALSPVKVRDLAPAITTDVKELLQPILDNGSCEFFRDFAQPMPTTVFCRLFGLPVEQATTFLQWETDLIHGSQHGDSATLRLEAGLKIQAYLEGLIADRLENPVDDLISMFTQSEVHGRRMTPDETLDMCYQLFIAGLDTVTSALSFCFSFLATHPEHRRQLYEDPSLVPNAIEELMRTHSFISGNRVAQADVEVGGVLIKKGETVLYALASGSRDESLVEHADTVDFTREGIKHLAFGIGPHRCVGSHLARMQLQIVMREWFAATEDFELAEGAEIVYRPAGSSGIIHLPLVVTPRAVDAGASA
ncbi:cytochrome P450 [Rhodococcus sp. BP-349]|uniref:cytochrome P450 n=1 Tax=unclassified Rhodococcus (in: high G+C Gram-positive bacteria) TaxID=192944 RepID=UPI001C9AB192|nr:MULTISPECIES: cytochrome P450 [unclassified Rhodococcus (in: high G+C Gram-positive bacteria)]MBY6537774.1 cytochrome P450 [Rhodococcus sp. BP-363]MBY6542111.1 cytochrome P450 [Rhodococcus sp. BP-369]MBY6561341.1 cytochrome P450 [Rhodococcus sp. BP-370]MBY6575633.1 cytochrome P450 [Rhodococcus sp. BP-364]MBY6584934.1 cytochrome P450 [Rhodococcus sp. BP-358]